MFYPTLNESPDRVTVFEPYRKEIAAATNPDAYAFGYYDDKFEISKRGGTHDTIFTRAKNQKAKQEKDAEWTRFIWDYPGRIWVDKKIISFWKYPKDAKTLKKIVEDLETSLKIKIWDDSEYKIEINEMESDSIDPWDAYTEDSVKLIPLKDYFKSEDVSVEKFKTPHKKADPGGGYGSNHPKYYNKQKEKMYMAAENYYPLLNETPNQIIKPETWERNKGRDFFPNTFDLIWWTADDNIPFGYYEDSLYIGGDWETHYDLAQKHRKDNEKYSKVTNGRGSYAGRIFTDYKVITFWQFPDNYGDLVKILTDLENKTDLDILGDNGWLIEVPVNLEKMEWTQRSNNTKDVEFVPVENYKGGHKRPERELKSPHISPDRNTSYGSGEKYQELQQNKRNMAAESYYPKIK